MTRPNLLQGLLEVVDAAGGQVDTRIKVQKIGYLLQQKGFPHFQLCNFSYHHFGPFSRELSDTLHLATLGGVLEEIREPLGESNYKYSYRLTDAGREFLAQSGRSSPIFADMAAKLSQNSWRALELAATVSYLEAEEALFDRSAAVDTALELKPETRSYVDEARSILEGVIDAR